MNDNISNWIEHPTEFYPPTDNIISIMEWHVALMKQIDKPSPKVWETVTDICEIQVNRDQIRREEDFFRSLDYPTIAKIETAVLIGRELWYGERSEYCNELKAILLSDYDKWSELFNVSLSGGNIAEAVDYTLSKRPEIWQAYVDAVS